MQSPVLAKALLTRVRLVTLDNILHADVPLRNHTHWLTHVARSDLQCRKGSWLAWADDSAAHYAAIHCRRQQTTGPPEHPADRYTTTSISRIMLSPR